MTTLLWEPSEERVAAANMTRFTTFVNDRLGVELDSYAALYRWSVDDIPSFWAAVMLRAGPLAPERCLRAFRICVLARLPGYL